MKAIGMSRSSRSPMIHIGALAMRRGPVGHPATLGAAVWFDTSVLDPFAFTSTMLYDCSSFFLDPGRRISRMVDGVYKSDYARVLLAEVCGLPHAFQRWISFFGAESHAHLARNGRKLMFEG